MPIAVVNPASAELPVSAFTPVQTSSLTSWCTGCRRAFGLTRRSKPLSATSCDNSEPMSSLAALHALEPHALHGAGCSPTCPSRVSGKKYGREDTVNGWLEDLERPAPEAGHSNGTSMTDGLPQTPAQQSGEARGVGHTCRCKPSGKRVPALPLTIA